MRESGNRYLSIEILKQEVGKIILPSDDISEVKNKQRIARLISYLTDSYAITALNCIINGLLKLIEEVERLTESYSRSSAKQMEEAINKLQSENKILEEKNKSLEKALYMLNAQSLKNLLEWAQKLNDWIEDQVKLNDRSPPKKREASTQDDVITQLEMLENMEVPSADRELVYGIAKRLRNSATGKSFVAVENSAPAVGKCAISHVESNAAAGG
ncbi:hypothetical protein PsalMR5_00770 [Piscirickettsia salmonis]|uniref:hypothetical protein n=1 Tax=Piscirickettsia salmonis TaxID=1238 RepID=UPI0012BABCD0|nr:hypothetical protein [Piscirickettsia salmonis]QGP53362.1 hypothetical protein PsalSR1_00772 [Piscirickettsia salmonis]QGP60719.1 hypothetical protein PsalBI1_03338 [Piscirickettsia salmonis]QGP62927.1 hypothetical protein PsalMR5_00770 [Piscirickettsia salmonis]